MEEEIRSYPNFLAPDALLMMVIGGMLDLGGVI
jgi:hypothetical protein